MKYWSVLGGENRERGSDWEGKKARPGLSVWIAHRKRVLTDGRCFRRFYEMDFYIICIFLKQEERPRSSITFVLRGKYGLVKDSSSLSRPWMGRHLFLLLFFVGFLEKDAPSCLWFLLISVTAGASGTLDQTLNQELGLFVFRSLSFLTFTQPLFSFSLAVAFSLRLHLLSFLSSELHHEISSN